MSEPTVTARGLADLLEKSPEWIRRHAKLEDIPGFKVGGTWRFFPSKVIERLEQPTDTWAARPRTKRRTAA